MPYKIINVELEQRSYPIYIGKDLLDNKKLLLQHLVGKQVMIVTNKTIGKLYLNKLTDKLNELQCNIIELPEGEQYKELTTLTKIFDALLENKHHRNTTLIALGGGVICDMTGFAAACYLRGVNFIQIPTTLLAQVDASIGGKTGVNHPLGKNMIGAFYQPQCVIIDINVLNTLSDRELSAGIAEIIKSALIRDNEFFAWLEKNIKKLLQRDPAALTYAIEHACAIKAKIVAEDEREITGTRALLNLGHTFGHAIEQVVGYGKWLHGEAVAVGMVLAALLSQQLGMLRNDQVAQIEQILIAAKLPIQLPAEIQYDKIFAAMAIDKKVQNGKLKFVLLQDIGNAKVVDTVDARQVRQALEENSS